ncbi:MAG: tRNA pseudouridine(38-40) synthase TruA [Bacilli bacterium]|nr:tRNA pseudouridine(38-40) synthase TruA [Bacilli bacterium]
MRTALVVSYEGTNFHGYQIQRPGLRTVQGQLQDALQQLTGSAVETEVAGRTDAGVHARGQIVVSDLQTPIPVPHLPRVLNTRLPADLRVRRAVEVPAAFNPRYDAVRKTYCYVVDVSRTGDVFKRFTAYYYPYRLDFSRLSEGAKLLKGTHDFTSFCAAATPVTNKVRTLYDVRVDLQAEEQLLRIWVTGSGFLWNMVRILVGTLLDVGNGKIRPSSIPIILGACDRTKAGHTAPAHGLTLWEVAYTDEQLNKSLYANW